MISSDTRALFAEAARVHTRITETCYYTEDALHLFWSGLRTINLGELAGPSPELSRGYAGMGILAGILRLHKLAEAWLRRALELAESLEKPYDLAWVLARDAVYRITVCDWDRAEREIERALSIARRAGDQRQWEEGMSALLFAVAAQGRFGEVIPRGAEVHASASRRGDAQILFWAGQVQAWARVRTGQPAEAVALLRVHGLHKGLPRPGFFDRHREIMGRIASLPREVVRAAVFSALRARDWSMDGRRKRLPVTAPDVRVA